ncbi:hypothetical protein FNV43_RR02736 [Rhamnella rubrinervis]|uniref:PPC domain-containing protein n=1 Tax=Rhamnella rubrinervis TaxID=2594499 RepID=A0A8K0MNL6_9ROSA|nr:hypothetical protein FNV43_RR02736 [Rhamnella rubrinervis]
MADYGSAISLSQARDLSHTSDDDDSDSSPRSVPTLSGSAGGGGSSSSKHRKQVNLSVGGAEIGSSSVEISKKPRGRPPGSKNKPKPPIFITKDSDFAMKPVILEISAGSDVVESVIQFARRRHVGVTVLSGSGSVSNVTLRHPSSHAPALSLHGPFSLLSLTGSFVGSSATTSSSSKPPSSSSSSFGICLAGAQGQVFGGIVGGKVIAASLVVVVAATYLNPSFHRLPSDATQDDHEVEESKPCIRSGGNDHLQGCISGSSTGMSMSVYNVASPSPINCQISPDHVMPWGPTSRPPY